MEDDAGIAPKDEQAAVISIGNRSRKRTTVGNRANTFLSQDLCRVRKCGQHIVACQLVLFAHLLNGHASSQFSDDEIYGHARAPDHRFSEPNGFVGSGYAGLRPLT